MNAINRRVLFLAYVVWLLSWSGSASAADAHASSLPFELFASAAAEPTSVQVGSEPHNTNFVSPLDLTRLVRQVTIFALLVACACATLLVLANRRSSKSNDPGQLHVVETVTLAPRCYCDLIKVRGQYFVAARDAAGLKELCPVSDFPHSFSEFVNDSKNEEVEQVHETLRTSA